MTPDELGRCMAQESDAHMKAAYGQMLSGAKAAGDRTHWHTAWRIELRKTGERLGGACFQGAPVERTVELAYGIDEAWRGQGYALEAVTALCNWAFSQGVYFITAEAEPNNKASLRVLESGDFRCIGMGEEGERWEKEKPKPNWLAAYLCLGLAVGCLLGAVIGRAMMGAGVSIGMGIGFAVGAVVGAALDKRDRQARQRSAAYMGEEVEKLFSNQGEDAPGTVLAGPLPEKPIHSAAPVPEAAEKTPGAKAAKAQETPEAEAPVPDGVKAKPEKGEPLKAGEAKKDTEKEKAAGEKTPTPKTAAKTPKATAAKVKEATKEAEAPPVADKAPKAKAAKAPEPPNTETPKAAESAPPEAEDAPKKEPPESGG